MLVLLFFYVSVPIPFNFILPKLDICFGKNIIFASFMTMPKATIYKNDRSVFAQYNIRMPRKSRVIQSISETTTKQEFPYQQFRLCILPFIADIQRCLCSLVSLSIIVVQITSYSFKEVFIITVYYFPYPVLSPTFLTMNFISVILFMYLRTWRSETPIFTAISAIVIPGFAEIIL